MRTRRQRFAVAAAACLLTSCLTARPSTHIQSVWKEPQFNPAHTQRTLVIGIIPDPARRRYFEDTLVKAIKKHHGAAEPSYVLWPTLDAVTRQTVQAVVIERKIDAVSLTRLVEKKSLQTDIAATQAEVPASPMDGAVSYFDESAKEVTRPGYTVNQTAAVLETKMFETRRGTCVWICRSETLINGFLDDLIHSFAEVMTDSLYGS